MVFPHSGLFLIINTLPNLSQTNCAGLRRRNFPARCRMLTHLKFTNTLKKPHLFPCSVYIQLPGQAARTPQQNRSADDAVRQKEEKGGNSGTERERERGGRVRGGLTCCDSSGQRLTDAQRPVTMRPTAIKRVILSHFPLRCPPSHCCRLQSLL